MKDPEQIIDIRDSEINVEEIMKRIRERIRQRRNHANALGLEYDRLVDDSRFVAGSGRIPADLYYELHQLRTNVGAIWVSVALYDSRLPLINSAYMRAKGKLHGIIVDYVNRLGGKQMGFNRTNERVLSMIVDTLEGSDARIQALEKEVFQLRERIANLEQRLGK